MKIEEAAEALEKHAADLIDLCPHCGAKAHIEALWWGHHRYRNGDVEFYAVFRCKPCQKLILKTFFLEQNRYSDTQNLEVKGWKDTYPFSFDDQLSPEEKEFVSPNVLSDYEEALQCKSVGADKASCAMFRRALQSALVILGANTGARLIDQINQLTTLPPDIKDWSHQIRIFGNWGAHPDEDQLKNVTRDDVLEVHDFMSKFLTYTFIMPAKVQASRQRRDARTASPDTSESQ